MWIPVHRDWRLNERHYGALQGLNKAETAKKFGETQVKLWRRSYDIRPPALEEEDPRHPRHDRALQGTQPGRDSRHGMFEGYFSTLLAMLARSHRAGGSFRETRAACRAREQPACAGQASRRSVRCRYRRAEHSHRYPAGIRTRRGFETDPPLLSRGCPTRAKGDAGRGEPGIATKARRRNPMLAPSKTKLVSAIGPTSDSPELMLQMLESTVDHCHPNWAETADVAHARA